MAKKINYADMFTLRSDGRYQGYWRELDKSGQPTGKRHTICDRDPATLYEKIQQKEQPSLLTFRDIAEAWKDAAWPEIKRGTQVCYSPALKRAEAHFGDRDAASIEPYEIKAHLTQLKKAGYSAKTVKTQRTVYRQIYTNAITDKRMGRQIRTNPVDNVPLPKNLPKQKKREAPEDDVVAKVRSAASTAYFGIFPLFVMATGFRRGEALSIRWQDIDFKAKTIHLTQQINYEGGIESREDPKTEAGVRDVPLLPDLYPLLKAMMPKDAKPTDYVFYGADPKRWMPQSTYQRRWNHYCREMGFVTDEPEPRVSKQGKHYIKHHYKNTLTAHVFRHGYATMLFEADVDEFTAQKLLGHSDVAITRAIYTHLRRKKKDSSIQKLESFVEAQISAPQIV